MKRKLFYIIGMLAILTSLLPGSVMAGPILPDPEGVPAPPDVRDWEPTLERIAAEDLAALKASAGQAPTGVYPCSMDTKYFLILDSYYGVYRLRLFDLVAQSPTSELWLAQSLAWPAGDPRPTPVVTCEQAAYMVKQFDTKIFPKETTFLGPPDFHDGSAAILDDMLGLPADYYYNASGRQMILVSNIRDNNYYNPTYPIYIAGFYSPTFEIYFDRNIMSIDAYDWANRIGKKAKRPYLYEGIFAHEYQHLLHADYDGDEETWVNEGFADLMMDLLYKGSASSHLSDTANRPENSLVVWGDQGDLEILADYGFAFLFMRFLMDHFGAGFMQALFHNPDNSITGVNSTFTAFGLPDDFASVFHDWSVALLIDKPDPNRRFWFKSLNFKLNIGTPSAPNPEAYDTPGAPPWGTDYIWVAGNPSQLGVLTFNGLDYSTFPTRWESDGNVCWGGWGDLMDNWAIFETTGGGTLSFDTWYDIEEYWDFGFVQVSTDGGHSWTSLANAYTTSVHDPDAHPNIVANLPGLTGYSGGWFNISYDLSAYAGQNILVAFRYMTDWATYYEGWAIDNVYVDTTLISNCSDVSAFKDITEIVPINNNFTVTFVGYRKTGKGYKYMVVTLPLDEWEDGVADLKAMLPWADRVAMLVTYDAPEGVTSYADYTYGFTFYDQAPVKK